MDTEDYKEDLKMLKSISYLPYSVAIPKIESSVECKKFLSDLGRPILILPQIETPRGIADIDRWDFQGIEFSGIGLFWELSHSFTFFSRKPRASSSD